MVMLGKMIFSQNILSVSGFSNICRRVPILTTTDKNFKPLETSCDC